MQTIFKYSISRAQIQLLCVPEGAEFLCAKEQNGQIVIWAKVDTEVKLKSVHITVYMTGQPMEKFNGKYIDTIIQSDGIVAHVFVMTEKEYMNYNTGG